MTQAGLEFRTGTSWTIDTPYRETIDEVRHYQAEGVLCVEMEAAALFCVAERSGVELASAFALSDEVGPDGWKGGFHAPEVSTSLWLIFHASVECLLELVGTDSRPEDSG